MTQEALKRIAAYPFSRAEELSVEQMREIAREALATLIEQPAQPQQAQGWKLVPVRPTVEMVHAGSDDLRLGGSIGTIVRAEECYRAMLNAAPQPAQRKPLTEGQISWFWGEAHNDTSDRMPFQVFAKAIEAAHGITEEQK